jgi:hypothetical protein
MKNQKHFDFSTLGFFVKKKFQLFFAFFFDMVNKIVEKFSEKNQELLNE